MAILRKSSGGSSSYDPLIWGGIVGCPASIAFYQLSENIPPYIAKCASILGFVKGMDPVIPVVASGSCLAFALLGSVSCSNSSEYPAYARKSDSESFDERASRNIYHSA